MGARPINGAPDVQDSGFARKRLRDADGRRLGVVRASDVDCVVAFVSRHGS